MPKISPYKHIIESQQFDQSFLTDLFALTSKIKDNPYQFQDSLKGKIVALLFYEPSTRTRLSFESAALRLGAEKITTENAREFSSAAKGETVEDSTQVLCTYADFIIMRHFDNDACEKAIKVATKPIINAGCGQGQHPTQALLDLFTIFEHFNRTEGLTIAVVGDLLRARTVNSLIYLLSKFKNNRFIFVSPENSKIKKGIIDHLKEVGLPFSEVNDLNSVIKEVDVVYMTRVQKERFDDMAEYEKAHGKHILTQKMVENMSPKSIIMHPLPRIDEIPPEIDSDSRAVYFQQAENGLYVRMALLKMLHDHNNQN